MRDTIRTMDTIKQLLPRAVQHNGIAASIDAARVVTTATLVLEDIFDPTIAARMRPLYLKNRTLTINCDSTTVAQELKLRETEILTKLEDRLGAKLIDRIRYFS
ncbi:MAG: DUF721 domain-containing protein [Patescibacteria group bacterium]